MLNTVMTVILHEHGGRSCTSSLLFVYAMFCPIYILWDGKSCCVCVCVCVRVRVRTCVCGYSTVEHIHTLWRCDKTSYHVEISF